jgi:Bacterial low temperature requirement A protein (LtrA)
VVGPLELFYDLAAVVLVAQAAHRLAGYLTWPGLGEFTVVFTLVWIAWANGSLHHELHGHEEARANALVPAWGLIVAAYLAGFAAVIITASPAQAAALLISDTLTERFGAVLIIVFGETLTGVVAGLSGEPVSGLTLAPALVSAPPGRCRLSWPSRSLSCSASPGDSPSRAASPAKPIPPPRKSRWCRVVGGSEGFECLGPGHDPAQGAVLVQVAEHLQADGLVQAAGPDRVESGRPDQPGGKPRCSPGCARTT